MNHLISSLNLPASRLLDLLRLASPALPVGAYSYSEGLETLVQQGVITSATELQQWLEAELQWGSWGLEGSLVARAYAAVQHQHLEQLRDWNDWWSAARETEELRRQSWQMGQSLSRLLSQLDPTTIPWLGSCGHQPNWAIVWGAAAAHWQINLEAALLAYFHTWISQSVGAGIKLIPLGQTEGQQVIAQLSPQIMVTAAQSLSISDADLGSCSWGLALASSQHETLRVRLFQS